MPIALSPIGITGMYARRGEIQAAKAAAKKGFLILFLLFPFAL